jgi:hypothetical protein
LQTYHGKFQEINRNVISLCAVTRPVKIGTTG